MPPILAPTPSTAPLASGQRRLHRLAIGEKGRVALVDGDALARQRLLDLGFCDGAEVSVDGRAPLGDPIALSLRGYRLSLRSDQAAQVVIEPAGKAPTLPQVPADAPPGATVALPAGRDLVVALAGNPNCGKTTLFNAITGLHQKVANYPGVTVDQSLGRAPLPGGARATIVDLPGTYSLVPTSPDEAVASEVLIGLRPDTPAVDVVCAVVDATNLARNLLLVTQLADLGLPMVVALTFSDIAKRDGRAPDIAVLERLLGVPVVAVSAHSGAGLVALGGALTRATVPHPALVQDAALADAVAALAIRLPELPGTAPGRRAVLARQVLLGSTSERVRIAVGGEAREAGSLRRHLGDAARLDAEARYQWIAGACAAALGQAATTASRTATRHRRIDAILLHRVWGYAIFAAVMWGLFASIFTFAAPLMDIFEKMLEGPGARIADLLGPGLLHDLWLDGIVAGVGGVLVFVPQIAVMFLLLSLLDESGYLARGAYLLDRALAAVGLHGKSFVPMLSAHACAIPAVMSARAVEHPRERLATILVTPFLVCGARLPVFALLIATCFGSQPGWVQGSIMWGLYVLGILAAATVAFILRRTALKGGSSSFMIELTPYQMPNVGQVARTVWRGVRTFLLKAGTIILTFSVLLWAAMTFPGPSDATIAAVAAKHSVTVEQLEAEPADADSESLKAARTALKAEHLSGSVAGHIGHTIEPVIAPFGADWKTGVGLVGAFAAREVFVSTMGVAYGASQADAEDTSSLRELMLADRRADGSTLWTAPFAAAILVWFVFAMQCMSTVAVMVRETKGWRWPLTQLLGMNAIAWCAAVTTYHIGLLIVGG